MEENTRNYISLNDALRVFEPLSLGLMVKPVGASCPLACNYCYYREAPRGVMPAPCSRRPYGRPSA